MIGPALGFRGLPAPSGFSSRGQPTVIVEITSWLTELAGQRRTAPSWFHSYDPLSIVSSTVAPWPFPSSRLHTFAQTDLFLS